MTPLGTAYQPAGKLGIGRAFLMLWVVVLVLFPGQWTLPVTDRDEARYSQAATQMMETGDYVDIRFQKDPRYVKPAGIYWMQVVAAQAFGQDDAPIGAYRIPSYLGVVITALVTALIGARIFGGAYGAIAGGILAFSILVAVDARLAKTDSMLMAAGALSQLALFQLLVQPKGSPPKEFRTWPLLFWFASGLAVLIKGPIIAIMTVATLVFYVGITRDWRALKRLRPLPGLVVFAVVGFTWVTAISIQTNGEFLRESVGHAFLGKVAEGDDDHGGWMGYHTTLLPALFWPGTALLGLGAAAAWLRRKEPAMVFLLAWALPFFIIYEIVGTKLPHYVMPVYPAFALLCAAGLHDVKTLREKGWAKGLHFFSLAIFALVTVALVPGLYFALDDLGANPLTPEVLALMGCLILTLIIGVAVLRKPSVNGAAYTAVPATLTLAVLAGLAAPSIDELWPSNRMWRVATQLEGCTDAQLEFATAGYREPSNVFYLGTETLLTDGQGAAEFLINGRGCRAAFVEEREREAFDRRMQGRPVRELAVVRGTNVSKGREMELKLIVMRTSPLKIGEGELRRL
ncbi:glycosyltransferase family 39 protein [Parvularcula sp. ZS-1/3]|uniref:Glycosyltransferase family 39 protein n=1 Tax=Parvularcula mediterranea TaxID=2732508 RepID=A0A7Y3RJZ1_9PROT|nr:glycosyltransferase family 39 protein [Parvularcula mediterranea]NNU14921.1 glycosyltransferase family 39 protein [Parvularcula mediterranea]